MDSPGAMNWQNADILWVLPVLVLNMTASDYVDASSYWSSSPHASSILGAAQKKTVTWLYFQTGHLLFTSSGRDSYSVTTG